MPPSCQGWCICCIHLEIGPEMGGQLVVHGELGAKACAVLKNHHNDADVLQHHHIIPQRWLLGLTSHRHIEALGSGRVPTQEFHAGCANQEKDSRNDHWNSPSCVCCHSRIHHWIEQHRDHEDLGDTATQVPPTSSGGISRPNDVCRKDQRAPELVGDKCSSCAPNEEADQGVVPGSWDGCSHRNPESSKGHQAWLDIYRPKSSQIAPTMCRVQCAQKWSMPQLAPGSCGADALCQHLCSVLHPISGPRENVWHRIAVCRIDVIILAVFAIRVAGLKRLVLQVGRSLGIVFWWVELILTDAHAGSHLSPKGARANQPKKARKKEMVETQNALMCGFCWTVPHTRSNGNSVAWLFLSTAHLKSRWQKANSGIWRCCCQSLRLLPLFQDEALKWISRAHHWPPRSSQQVPAELLLHCHGCHGCHDTAKPSIQSEPKHPVSHRYETVAELARSRAAHLHQTYSARASCANFSSTTTPVSHAGEGSSKSLKLAKLWLCGLRVSKQNLTYAHFCGSMPGVPLTSFPLGSLSGIVQWRRYASTFISLWKNAWYLRYTLTVKGKLPLPPATTIVRQIHQSINHKPIQSRGIIMGNDGVNAVKARNPNFGEFLPQCSGLICPFASLRKALWLRTHSKRPTGIP